MSEPRAPMADDNQPIVINEDGRPARRHWWRQLDRRQKLIVGSVSLVVLAALIFGGLKVFGSHGSGIAGIGGKKTAAQKTKIVSQLTGLQIASADLNKRPVTGIMIENSPDARPQSGLQDAGIVFEAIAEGGITRFLALYQDAQPSYVGPVRSLRPYYLDWAAPFEASIAHVGGSPEALDQVRSGMRDLDQFFNDGAYSRIQSRPSPHNVYTSFSKLDALNQSKGYTSSSYNPWPRKEEAPLVTPAAKTIDINLSGPLYSVEYQYDKANNYYFRYEGGAPQYSTTGADPNSKYHLRPKIVIALVIPYSIEDSAGHSNYATNGSGPLFIFQDGGVNTGNWFKDDRNSQYVFKDPNGNVIKLDPGQTWVTAVGATSDVSYQP